MTIDLLPSSPTGSISRTAMETHHACPRKRFLGYEWMRGLPVSLPSGETVIHCGGLSQAKPASALLTGSAVHEGFASLLASCKRLDLGGEGWQSMRRDPNWHLQIDVAAQTALTYFDRAALEQGISFGLDPGAAEWYTSEQRALVEGLVWIAGLRLVPELISHYRIVDVEREERMELGAGVRPFAARADALLAERDSGDLSVFSLKTGAMYGRKEEMKFKRDVQGLSEAIALERRLGQKIATVQMALLIKGTRRLNEKAGRKEHYSPLTRAWRLMDPLTGIQQWAWSYDTPKVNAKTGESYIGKLGKDFTATPAWEYPGGIRAWVLALDRGEIQGELGDALAGCMAVPEPWARAESEMEDWLEQALVQEREVEEGAEVVNLNLAAGNLSVARRMLNIHFPQNRSACISYNQSCSFDAVCWGGQGLVQIAQGFAPDGLKLRTDHHAEESEEE